MLLKGLASSKPAGHPLSAQICTLVAPRGTRPFPGTCNRSLPVTSPPVSEPMSVISLVWPVHASPAGSVLGLDAAVGCNAQGYTPVQGAHPPQRVLSAHPGQGQGASRPGLMAYGGWERGEGKGLESLGGGYRGAFALGSRKRCLRPEARATLGSCCSVVSDPCPVPLAAPISTDREVGQLHVCLYTCGMHMSVCV